MVQEAISNQTTVVLRLSGSVRCGAVVMALDDVNGQGNATSLFVSSGSHGALSDIVAPMLVPKGTIAFARGNVGVLADIDNTTGLKASRQTILMNSITSAATNIILNLTRGNLLKRLTNKVYTEI
jgi:hypothetical protein